MIAMSKGGELSTTYPDLIAATTFSERTIMRAIRVLESIGAVEKKTGRGARHNNRYKLRDFGMCVLLGEAPKTDARKRPSADGRVSTFC